MRPPGPRGRSELARLREELATVYSSLMQAVIQADATNGSFVGVALVPVGGPFLPPSLRRLEASIPGPCAWSSKSGAMLGARSAKRMGRFSRQRRSPDAGGIRLGSLLSREGSSCDWPQSTPIFDCLFGTLGPVAQRSLFQAQAQY